MRVTSQTKSATRQRILDVARKQFAAQGFEASTTRDIARASQIGVGTLFNYFATKESIALTLITDAWENASREFVDSSAAAADSEPERSAKDIAEPLTFEEELFAHMAVVLRKLKPYRKYLPAVLESSLSPLSLDETCEQSSLRTSHLETVSQIACKHGEGESLSPVAMQLYWTLCTGVLAFWASDRSPRQEDTLALLDQSLAMFAGWITQQSNPSNHSSNDITTKKG